MSWYKRAASAWYILGTRDSEWMGKDGGMWWEAFRLKNGETVYADGANHWMLKSLCHGYIGSVRNIESTGLLGDDGVYQVKLKGRAVQKYFLGDYA